MPVASVLAAATTAPCCVASDGSPSSVLKADCTAESWLPKSVPPPTVPSTGSSAESAVLVVLAAAASEVCAET